MLDHFDARLWADHHTDFGDTIVAALNKFADIYRVNSEHLYAAPWQENVR